MSLDPHVRVKPRLPATPMQLFPNYMRPWAPGRFRVDKLGDMKGRGLSLCGHGGTEGRASAALTPILDCNPSSLLCK